jgi:hypothetical protein
LEFQRPGCAELKIVGTYRAHKGTSTAGDSIPRMMCYGCENCYFPIGLMAKFLKIMTFDPYAYFVGEFDIDLKHKRHVPYG